MNHQGVCNSLQINTAASDCINNPNSSACTAFQQANPTCAKCMFGLAPGESPTARATNPQPSLLLEDGAPFAMPNIYSCAAAIMGQPSLAQPINDAYACMFAQCKRCDPNDPNEIDQCFTDAQNGMCSQLVNDAINAQNVLSGAQSQWDLPCGASQGSLDQAFVVATQTVCGL